VLFGTDYPLLAPERWLRDFEALDLKSNVRPKIPKIPKDNAVRFARPERRMKKM
jgi:predicted TIM-barrel fold metal-dependent hydrolase